MLICQFRTQNFLFHLFISGIGAIFLFALVLFWFYLIDRQRSSLVFMDSNICLFHAFEKCSMAFCGPITQERWNHLLRPIDDMSREAVSQDFGEGFFSYQYSWRTNIDIVGLWVGCLARAGVAKQDIVRITHNIFDPYWLVGLESAITKIDAQLRIPLLEAYMEFDVNIPQNWKESKTLLHGNQGQCPVFQRVVANGVEYQLSVKVEGYCRRPYNGLVNQLPEGV